MTSSAEISSLSSTLTELHQRVTAMAEGALASGDEEMAQELIAVERSRAARCAASGDSPRTVAELRPQLVSAVNPVRGAAPRAAPGWSGCSRSVAHTA
jgi:hypothetical protein